LSFDPAGFDPEGFDTGGAPEDAHKWGYLIPLHRFIRRDFNLVSALKKKATEHYDVKGTTVSSVQIEATMKFSSLKYTENYALSSRVLVGTALPTTVQSNVMQKTHLASQFTGVCLRFVKIKKKIQSVNLLLERFLAEDDEA
jgi:hypothetical protein